MKKSIYFAYGCIVTLSIFLMIFAFELGDNLRGYNAVGGEAFFVALPLVIMWSMITTAEQRETEKNNEIQRLRNLLKQKSSS